MPPADVPIIPDGPDVDVALIDSGLGCNDGSADPRSEEVRTPPGLVVPAYSDGAVSGPAFDIVEREFIELEILGNFDAMLVGYANKKSCDGSPAWCKLTGLLSNLGYDFGSDHCWKRLGIAKYEGPNISKQLIGRRGSIAEDILGSIPDTLLRPGEIATKARWTVETAYMTASCLEELPDAVRMRGQSSKLSKDRLQRWAEASPRVIDYILSNLEGSSLCLLNLSNVLKARMGKHSPHTIASTKVARARVGRILMGGSSAIEALGEIQDRDTLLWCPDSKDDLGRVCSALALAIGSGTRTSVTFVIPLNPRPGCHQFDQFTDTWSHELLKGKWQLFVSAVKFSAQPVRIVLSGLHAPMHHFKSLCLVTLCCPGTQISRRTMTSIDSLGVAEGQTLVLIDIREADEAECLATLAAIEGQLFNDIRGPTRSMSSSRQEARIMYSCTVKRKGTYAARSANFQIKMALVGIRPIVGLSSTYGDPESLLVDVTNVAAVNKIIHLVEDAVMISQKLMIARSTASVVQWTTRVAEIAEEKDNSFVDKVRYRPSQGGGIITAIPILEEEKARRRSKGKDVNGKDTMIIFRFTGDHINSREANIPAFMSMISHGANMRSFHPEPVVVIQECLQWRVLLDARSGWRGDVSFRCEDKAQAIALHSRIDGKSIDCHDHCKVFIEVITHASIAIEARNAIEA
jgi:hypothetical protein